MVVGDIVDFNIVINNFSSISVIRKVFEKSNFQRFEIGFLLFAFVVKYEGKSNIIRTYF